MTRPQAAIVAPVIAYADAPLVEPDPRSLVRFRLGADSLIAYMAISLLGFATPVSNYVRPLIISICSITLLALAAILISSNTRLPSDKAVLRYLLIACASITAFFVGFYVLATRPAFAFLLNFFNSLYPVMTTAYAITIAMLFIRLAMLARYFNSPNLVRQFHALAAMFVASYSLSLIILAPFIGSVGRPATYVIVLLVRYARPALSLWAAVAIPFLLPRLRSSR